MQKNYFRRIIALYLICSVLLSLTTASIAGETLFRLKPSTPKELITEIYNNALTGNDRLSDIESYMSSGLKRDYKKALKYKKIGRSCDFPRVLTNGIFSGKLNGFRIELGASNYWSTQLDVVLDTRANNLRENDQLRKFDPKIYEKISFKLTRRLIDWKIDDIQSQTPNLNDNASKPSYASLDLRKMLQACK